MDGAWATRRFGALALVVWLAFGVAAGCSDDRGELENQEDSILCEEAVAHLEGCCGLELRVSCRGDRLTVYDGSDGCALAQDDHPCTEGKCSSEPVERPDISPDASRCWSALGCEEIRDRGDCDALRDQGYESVDCP